MNRRSSPEWASFIWKFMLSVCEGSIRCSHLHISNKVQQHFHDHLRTCSTFSRLMQLWGSLVSTSERQLLSVLSLIICIRNRLEEVVNMDVLLGKHIVQALHEVVLFLFLSSINREQHFVQLFLRQTLFCHV